MGQKKFEIDGREINLVATMEKGNRKEVVLKVAMTPVDSNPQKLHSKGKEGFDQAVSECLRDCAKKHNYTIDGRNIRPKAHNINTSTLSFRFDVRNERTLMPTS